jgi:hypothetical protein
MKHILYCITRDDGQKYVGITIDYRIKNRMACHALSDRFKGHSFTYEIVLESENRKDVEDAEEKLIIELDTFHNGLNSTLGGKGYGHNSPNFSTFGYKFNDESKKKMSQSAKDRAKREGFDARSNRSKEFFAKDPSIKEKMSAAKKGKKSWSKISDDDIQKIISGYHEFNDDMIGLKSKNGRVLTKSRLYARHMSKQFPVCENMIYSYVKDL